MYLWVTDPHFDKLFDQVTQWGKEIQAEYPHAKGMIITGDISTGRQLERHLKDLVQGFGHPVYFVVGNHDYWHSSFEKIDEFINSLIPEEGLVSLEGKFIPLTSTVALVGSSGFYDAIYGDSKYIEEPTIEMNDWHFIEELTDEYIDQLNCNNTKHSFRLSLIRERSANLAMELLQQISLAQKAGYSRILVATHFPPFEELIKKEPSKIPYYGSAYMGNAIISGSTTLDEVIVLSGHSHQTAFCVQDGKIFSYCGKARYGVPEVVGIFDENEFEVHLL